MSTFGLIVLIVIGLLLYIIYRITNRLFSVIKKFIREAYNKSREQRRREELLQEEERRREELLQEKQRRREELLQEEQRRREELLQEEQRIDAFKESVAKAKIVSSRIVFDTSRKYHFETTFMLYFNDGTKTATTVEDGSDFYDFYIGKLEE